MPVELGREEFEALVDRALDGIPEELAALVSNVAVLVEDDPPPDEPDLLGLYDGVALTDQTADFSGFLPARILIFRRPLQRLCDSPEELEEEVLITVVHEVAHHFGIDDERLHTLGWG